MPGSLKEALRQALEEDDTREVLATADRIEAMRVSGLSVSAAPIVETVERSEMTFEEQAGELIPQEVGE